MSLADTPLVLSVGWILHTVILLLGAIFFVIPCWVRLWQWRSEHHIITRACLLLLIPDFILILDFVPIHIRDLVMGELVDDNYCKASSFIIVTCILASNVGNITVAYVTKRMLDPKDQKVTNKTLYVSAAVSWTLGLLLASYFAGMGYLGSHRGVYCCTTKVRRGDIAGPVFFVYAVCISAMVYLYRKAYVQVASVVMPSSNVRTSEADSGNGAASPRTGAANGQKAVGAARKPGQAITSIISGAKSSDSIEAEETIARIADAQGQQQHRQQPSTDGAVARSGPSVDAAASPTVPKQRSLRSPASNSRAGTAAAPAATQSASASIARRAILMVVTYYACWSLISLNAVFELAGWQDRSLWWDVIAAMTAKLQPSIDAMILLASMYKVHEKREAMKQRNNESSQNAARLQVKVDGSQLLKSGAMSPRSGMGASPSGAANGAKSRSRLISNGAVSPRAAITVAERPASAAAPASPAAPVESPPPPADETGAGESEADHSSAANGAILHRRTVSSEIVQYA